LIDIAGILTTIGEPYEEKDQYFEVECPNHHPNSKLKIYKDSAWCHCFHGSCGYSVSFGQYVKGVNPRVRVPNNQTPKKTKHPQRLIVKLPLGYTKWPDPYDDLKITRKAIDTFNIGYCKNGFKDTVGTSCEGCYFFDLDKQRRRWITDWGTCSFARGRIMTPITSKGDLYSIESRDVTGQALKKVVYPHLSKTSLTIFNYDKLDRSKPLMVVEGIKSAIRIWEDISKNVTAIFSNRLKGDQAEILKEFEHIVLIPDLGESGKATIEDFDKLGVHKLDVVIIPTLVLCKDCGTKCRGDEKKDVCPECQGDRVSYGDAFDIGTDTLTRLITIRKSTTVARLKRMGTKVVTHIKSVR